MDKYLVLSKQAEEKNKREDVKKLCDIFEAFMGALYVDVNGRKKEYRDIQFDGMSNIGFQVCEAFYINIVEEEIDFEDIIANDSNHKSKLIQYYHLSNHSRDVYFDVHIKMISFSKHTLHLQELHNS